MTNSKTNGARLMPMRVLGPLILAFIPTAGWPWWAIALQSVLSALVVFFAPAEPLGIIQKFLLAAMIFDLIFGALCGRYTRGGFKGSKMSRGVLVKMGVFALVIYLSQPWLQVEIWGARMSIGSVFAIFYSAGEWKSVFEKLDELGVPPPKWVRSWVSKARDTIDDASPTTFAGKDAGWDELRRRIASHPPNPHNGKEVEPPKEERLP